MGNLPKTRKQLEREQLKREQLEREQLEREQKQSTTHVSLNMLDNALLDDPLAQELLVLLQENKILEAWIEPTEVVLYYINRNRGGKK